MLLDMKTGAHGLFSPSRGSNLEKKKIKCVGLGGEIAPMAAHESGLQDAKVMEMSVSEQWGKSFGVPCLGPAQHREVVGIVPCPCTRRFHPRTVPATSTDAETVTPLKQAEVLWCQPS